MSGKLFWVVWVVVASGCAFKEPVKPPEAPPAPSTPEPQLVVSYVGAEGRVIENKRRIVAGAAGHLTTESPFSMPLTVPASLRIRMDNGPSEGLSILESRDATYMVEGYDGEKRFRLQAKDERLSSGEFALDVSDLKPLFTVTEDKTPALSVALTSKAKRSTIVDLAFVMPPSRITVATLPVAQALPNLSHDSRPVNRWVTWQGRKVYILAVKSVSNLSAREVELSFSGHPNAKLITEVRRFSPVTTGCSHTNTPSIEDEFLSDQVWLTTIDDAGALGGDLGERTSIRISPSSELRLAVLAEGERAAFRRPSSLTTVQVPERCDWECPNERGRHIDYCQYPSASYYWDNREYRVGYDACCACNGSPGTHCNTCKNFEDAAERGTPGYPWSQMAVFCRGMWFQRTVMTTTTAGTETGTFLDVAQDSAVGRVRYDFAAAAGDPVGREVNILDQRNRME